MTTSNPPDASVFPDSVYQRTVLEPLFDAVKRDHVDGFSRIDRAHLVMLAETGILDAATAHLIAAALVDIENNIDPQKLFYTGDVEDYFFLVEGELKARLGADVGGRLHTARSRNDIDHTLFRLRLRQLLDGLLAQLDDLLAALLETAGRNRDTIIVAYTHGQPAQPTTFGHYLGAIIETLIRDIERIEAARSVVNFSPLGSAAITTTGFAIDRHRTAHLLGFAAPLRNSYSGIAGVDYISATYGALELLFLHLGRPVQDFQFWTAFEVGQLYVPNSLVQISSIMPQKRNPVPIEHLRHLTSQALGRSRAVLDILHNTPFTDMNDSEGETQAFGYEAFAVGGRVLELFARLVASVSVNSDRVANNIRRSCITITELADTLVREENLSFRQAHEVAAAVARDVLAKDGDLASDGHGSFVVHFHDLVGRPSVLGREQYERVVSASHFVAVRNRFGGPAPEALDAAFDAYRGDLQALRQRRNAAAAALSHAEAELAQSFQNLVRSA